MIIKWPKKEKKNNYDGLDIYIREQEYNSYESDGIEATTKRRRGKPKKTWLERIERAQRYAT